MKKKMLEIVVFLKQDYTQSDKFEVPKTTTVEQITKIVNELYKEWYYFDIW